MIPHTKMFLDVAACCIMMVVDVEQGTKITDVNALINYQAQHDRQGI